MILIGLGFKVAAAPFQIWTPTFTKARHASHRALFRRAKGAAFALLLRIFATFLPQRTSGSGVLDSRGADNVRRKLGRIGADEHQAVAGLQFNRARGYILVAFAAVTSMAKGGRSEAAAAYAAVLFYLLSYALVSCAFTIVSQLGGPARKISRWTITRALAAPAVVAGILSIYLLSLLGLPVTAALR